MELNLSDKQIANLIGAPFWYSALYLSERLTDKDLDYLLNTIKKHPCFELVENARCIDKMNSSPVEIANTKINQIVFYDIFYLDLKCPKGIKNILFFLLGKWRYEADNFCLGLLEFRYKYVKKWMDSITEKSLNQDRC